MKEKAPTLILQSKAETLQRLFTHDESHRDYSIKSEWLMDELDRFECDGFVYNRDAQERICNENGFTFEDSCRRFSAMHTRTEGGLLGTLIYNAQKYRRVRKLQRDGWVRVNQELLAPLVGKKVTAICNGSLSGKTDAVVKRFGEKVVLAPPRTRTKSYAMYEDWWIRPSATNPSTPDA